MKIIENKTAYHFEELVGIAKRENNSIRSYLYVNRYQGKHVPVRPGIALSLFEQLGAEVYPDIIGQDTAFVGFAETATAIGAAVAAGYQKQKNHGAGFYLQTTREALPEAFQVVDFKEEHSHATEQLFYCRDKQRMLKDAEHIIFVEDELTTGKTILNFVRVLEKHGYQNKFSVVSILNSMTDEHLEVYKQLGIGVYYLIRFENEAAVSGNGIHVRAQQALTAVQPQVSRRNISGRLDSRLGQPAGEYLSVCDKLAGEVVSGIADGEKNILILGTEELMYPALYCGKKAETVKPDCMVKVHATTRSPIAPGESSGYPLHNRSELESIYEAGRRTFIYNLDKYDRVIIITDAVSINEAGVQSLVRALGQYGNEKIDLIRWCD